METRLSRLVSQLPTELLINILEALPKGSLASAARACRAWAPVATMVLWRSPPEDLLRAMRVPDRQRVCRAYVTDLSVQNPNVKRIFETPMPRLQRLHVSQRVLLDRPVLFCQFLHDHCRVDDEKGGTRPADTSTWCTALSTLSVSVLSEARTRPVLAVVFAMLALRPGLRRLIVRSEVTTEAVQAALDGKSAADAHYAAGSLCRIFEALLNIKQGRNRHLFHNLQGLDVVLKPDAALHFLPILRVQTLTALHLSFVKSVGSSGCSGMATILAAVTRFTELRSLKLESPSLLPPSASDILQLRQLRHLRALHVQSAAAWNELTDGVICELLSFWPRLAKLALRVPTSLSNGVVPAIGVHCPGLLELELVSNLDSRCFDSFDEKAPVLPHLTRLAVHRAILIPGSSTWTQRKLNAEIKRMTEVLVAHAPRLAQHGSSMDFTYLSRFAYCVMSQLRRRRMMPAERAAEDALIASLRLQYPVE